MRRFLVSVDGKSYEVEIEEMRTGAAATRAAAAPVAPLVSKPEHARRQVPAAEELRPGTLAVKAPMPGTMLSISVKEGDSVKSGQVLCRLEAMKMENEIRAVDDAVIQSVEVRVGDQISAGETIFILA